MRAPSLLALVGALAVSVAAPLRSQVPVTPRPLDSLRVDSLRADSIRRADTLSTTDRLLRAQKDQLVQLQPMPVCGGAPLQPAGSKYSFTRDSIDWAAAESVGELLQRIPGVFLEQSDWLSSPALPNMFGRAGGSVVYLLDCVPLLPLGIDSTAVDGSTYKLLLLDRIDVEESPGMLRVFLFTRRHNRAAPRTKIGVSQGDRGAARYGGMFEQRFPSGVGLSLGADYVGVNAPEGALNGSNVTSEWAQFSYVRSPHFGLQAELMSNAISRSLLLDPLTQDTLSRQVDGSRTDVQIRAAFRERADGLGRSLDVFYMHSSWASDSAPGNQAVGGAGFIGALRQPAWSAQLSTWLYSRQTLLDSHLDLGWAPTDRLSGSLQLVGQRHDGNRTSQWVTARIGFKLPLGFRIGGTVSDGSRVQSPALATDLAQRFTDAQVTAGFDSKLLTIEGGYTSNDGWRPQAYPEFTAIASLAPFPRTGWVTGHVRLAPVGFFTLETVYQNPVSGGMPDGSPPQHFLSTATLRSRFLRNFPSGIFDLKLQVVMENWSAGIGGRDTLGVAIPLPAATFFRGIVQMQIGPFIVYYDKLNLQATGTGYVPGYPMVRAQGTFGIRWEFSN
jgi:hypothetical protein